MTKTKKFLSILIRIVLVTILIISFSYIVKYYNDLYKSKQEKNILNHISVNENTTNANENINEEINPEIPNTDEDIETEPIKETKTERMLQIEELKKENSDIIGWIEIENTEISYPVLQGSDNSYYINHNYKKEKSKNGAIFLDSNYNWDIPSSNLLIYGHNMKNNTMFQHLLNYKNKTFFDEHPVIRFTTTSEDVYYEIISVFESRVYYQSEKNAFRYYYFINAENEAQYNEYVQNAKQSSLYDTGRTANYGEQLITLSTCSYHTKDGRFVVVAKKGINYSA